MRVLIQVILLILSYSVLSSDWGALWQRVLLVAFLVLSFLLWLAAVDLNRSSKLLSFRRLRKVDVAVGGAAIITMISVLFFTFLKTPEMALQARKELVHAVQGDDVKLSEPAEELEDDQPKPDKVKGAGDEPLSSFESPEGEVVNDESSTLVIPKRINLKKSLYPEVYLTPLDDQSNSRLRGQSLYLVSRRLSHFDGLTWKPTDAALEFNRANSSGWVALSKPDPEREIHYKIQHGGEQSLLLALQGVNRVKLPYLRSMGDAKVFLPPLLEEGNRTYEMTSSPSQFSTLSIEDTGSLRPGRADDLYTELPADGLLVQRIKAIAAPIKAEGGTWSQLQALRYWFTQNCDYSLVVDNPGDHDPIVNFLDYEKKGFCLHYATATALICRELGIPSRMVVGYVGGQYFESRNMYVFYTKDLHAWVEVKLGDYGWVSLDTSPAQFHEPTVAKQGEQPKPILERSENQLDMEERRNEEQLSIFDISEILTQTKWIMVVIFSMLMILMACFVWQRVERKKRRRRADNPDQRVHHEQPAYLALFRKVCELNGVPMLFGDTLRAHMEALELKDLKPDFGDSLLQYHYDTTYRESDKCKSVEASLLKQMKSWKL